MAIALVAIWTVAEMTKKTMNTVSGELRGQTAAMWKSISQYENGIKTLSERNMELQREIDDLRDALKEANKQNALLGMRLDTVAQAQIDLVEKKVKRPVVIKSQMLS